MWVICFYLHANKNTLSTTVIRGCGRGGEREKEETSFFALLLRHPGPLSQQLVVVVVSQVPPGARSTLLPIL